MSRFKPGQSGNPNGRPKGSSNKDVSKLRDAFSEILEGNVDLIKEDILELDPKDRLNILVKMAAYILPKPKDIELQYIPGTSTFRIEDVIKIKDDAPKKRPSWFDEGDEDD